MTIIIVVAASLFLIFVFLYMKQKSSVEELDGLYLKFDKAMQMDNTKKAFRYIKSFYNRQGILIEDEEVLLTVLASLKKETENQTKRKKLMSTSLTQQKQPKTAESHTALH